MTAAEPDGYQWVPIPKPPFTNEEDERAALGAAVAAVTYKVLGRWPDAKPLLAAVDVLRDNERGRLPAIHR